MSENSVLVTGADGFIGRCALPLLEKLGYEVHAASINPPPPWASGYAWRQCDLLSPGQGAALCAAVRPAAILHLAWYTAHAKYWTAGENLAWVQASIELLRAFAEAGGQRIVVAGTCAEYDWRYGYCSEALTPLKPATLYGLCKNGLHALVAALACQYSLSAAWGRLFHLYGPFEDPRRLTPSIILPLLRSERAICAHSSQWRDFLFVEDAAAALVAVLHSNVSGAVNIASGVPVSLGQLSLLIASKTGHIDLMRLQSTDDGQRLLLADTDILNRVVGWTPSNSLESGIERTIQWWKKNLPG